MNKKVLLLTASLLALIMLVTPVMSVSPKKIPVELDFAKPPVRIPAPEWITGNAQHGIGETMFRYDYSVTGGFIDLTGGVGTFDEGIYNVNLENGRGAKHFEVEIDFGDGTFEGSFVAHGIFFITGSGWAQLYDGVQHAQLQGTGAYECWKLVWTYERIDGVDVVQEAYMLIP